MAPRRGNENPPGSGEEHTDELGRLAKSFRGSFKTVEDMASAFVREAIIRGVYRPGERLQQDTIAEILGISRMPVRAGLRQLEIEGLLEIQPHRGATVTVLTPEEIKEIYELRTLLECYLVERAVPKLTQDVLTDLKALVEDLEDTSSSRDSIERRTTFYERLYALAERPRAVTLVSRLRAEVGRYLLLHRVDEHPDGHFGLISHLEGGDTKGAQRWLRDHLSRVSREQQALVAGVDPGAAS
ncbi:MAG: GntR family transcriptional regulator [Mycobacteriales bacterium]